MKFLSFFATLLAIAVGLGGVALALYTWELPPFESRLRVTDNAYVRGRVTMLSPQLAGYIAEVAVDDYQVVKKDQLLVRIDDRIFKQRVDQANAALASQYAALANSEQQRLSAEANIRSDEAGVEAAQVALETAQANLDRITSLTNRGVTTRSDSDTAKNGFEKARAELAQANANLDVAKQNLQTVVVARQSLEAGVEGAKAAVKLAEIDLENTRIVAPEAGELGEVGVKLGQYVSPGTQLMAVVPPETWVIANFKETQIRGLRPGMAATMVLDIAKDITFAGKIDAFSPATGSEFSVLRPDNATGNFTKVAQRLPIRIKFDEGQEHTDRLSPGLSVVVTIDPDQPPPAN